MTRALSFCQYVCSSVSISPGKLHPSHLIPHCLNPFSPHPWDYLAFMFFSDPKLCWQKTQYPCFCLSSFFLDILRTFPLIPFLSLLPLAPYFKICSRCPALLHCPKHVRFLQNSEGQSSTGLPSTYPHLGPLQ